MDRIRELLNKPVAVAVLAGVAGLILGLVFAWVIWPVQYFDAYPMSLNEADRVDYLTMAIDSYARNGDKSLAMQRWEKLGDTAQATLTKVQLDQQNVNPNDIAKFRQLVTGAAGPVVPQPQATGGAAATVPAQQGQATAAAPTAAPAAPSTRSNLSILLVTLCVLTLAIAGTLAYLFIFRNKRPSFRSPVSQAADVSRQVAKTEYAVQGQEAPVAQFMTTYMAGDDLYDDSFSIDAPSGEFLGECGVGISDTVGVGDPKKVTAFELWLFDKNDIQTITKVLMSEHAYNDPAIRQRLASKGEPVLIEPGQHILLETATLQLEARVVDAVYGQSALPANSYFERLTLELAVWPKPAA